MNVWQSLHRKRAGGAGRLRRAAVILGFCAFLAGCCGTSLPRSDSARSDSDSPNTSLDPPPLPITRDGYLRDGSMKLTSFEPRDASRSSAADADWTTLPSPQLATDGPVARFISPTNDGPWTPDQAVLPWAEFRNEAVEVHNIRNSLYRTVDDYTVRLYNKTFDLRRLTSIDLIVVPFNDDPSIAHVALSFGFEDKDFLVSSVEIRKRAGQEYSALYGFFNQYTLMYVLVNERDLIWKETIGFSSELYIYRTKATPKQAQEIFVDVMRRVNKLAREPEFYNTITNNCTTNVRNHVNRILPDKVPYDYRVLLPGYSDEMAYDLGLIKPNGSFAETRAAAKINYKAYLYRDAPEFSQKIREP